jgi:hypothetical protein
MSEMEMMNEVETEEFTDELSDEALDREEGVLRACGWRCTGNGAPCR